MTPEKILPRLFITGGSGFIGSRLARLAVERGHAVTVVTAVNNATERARCDALAKAGIAVLVAPLEDSFALAFEVGGTMLRVTTVKEVAKAAYTVLGWQVPNILRAAKSLEKAGVSLERYAGIEQDELGIWKSPSGARVAWFKDPDGNTLSITQF